MLGPFRFLVSNGDVGDAREVLLIQTGDPELLALAVDMLSEALPRVRLTVLLRRNVRGRVRLRENVEYLDNDRGKSALVRDLAGRRFDAAFVLYANQPGYWKLKLLPFLIGVPRIYAINEHLGWFPLTLRKTGPLLRHLASRAGAQDSSGIEAAIRLTGGVARSALSPAIAAWLFAYERIASARASLHGGVRWKDDYRLR